MTNNTSFSYQNIFAHILVTLRLTENASKCKKKNQQFECVFLFVLPD